MRSFWPHPCRAPGLGLLITYRLASPVTPAPRPDLTSSLHASLARPMDPVAVPVPLAQPAIQPASQPSRPATAGRVQLLAWIQTRCDLCKHAGEVCDLAGQLASQQCHHANHRWLLRLLSLMLMLYLYCRHSCLLARVFSDKKPLLSPVPYGTGLTAAPHDPERDKVFCSAAQSIRAVS